MTRSLAVAAVLLAWGAPAPAQLAPAPITGDSTLALALRLVTEGRGDSARALVRSRLRQLSPTDPLYPEALFVAGSVSAGMDSAMFHFRRVALDYTASPWADDALLRVAQLAFAGGDLETARRSTQRVLNDYPFSDVRAAAAYWAGRVLLEEDQLTEACAFLRQARAEAGDDIELANRTAFYLQRCTTVGAAAPTSPDSVRAAPSGTLFTVQVAAVRTAAAADELMRSLRSTGYESRVVRDADGLLKVRAGRFRTRADAERLRDELRRRLGGQPFVVEER